MDKFEKAIIDISEQFLGIKEILIVFLYGSVARKDYSLRHSDIDVFIVLKQATPKEKTIEKIDSLIARISAKNLVRIHAEYQGTTIKDKDASLIKKIIEEGKTIYSSGVFCFQTSQIGLKTYLIYFISAKDKKTKTRISQIMHGKKSWYYKGKQKIVKEYKGIIDEKEIIGLGGSFVMVINERKKYFEEMIQQIGAKYELKRIVYA